MKQVMTSGGQIQVVDVPAPLICDGHVLVSTEWSLISSGTETAVLRDATPSLTQKASLNAQRARNLVAHLRRSGISDTVGMMRDKLEAKKPELARSMGYSSVGTVVQVGTGVDQVSPGDRVACAGAGLASHADMVLVPKQLVTKVPDNLAVRDAASVAVGGIALQGVRRAQLALGETVAVIGLGLLGQITVQLLIAAGARVIGVDIDTRRNELARLHGAERVLSPSDGNIDVVVRAMTQGHGVDATILTAASAGSDLMQEAMTLTRKRGRVVVVGSVGMDLQRSPFYEKEIDVLMSTSYGPGRYDSTYEQEGVDYPYAYVRWTEQRNMQEYLRLLATGQVRLERILERDFEVEEAPRAYAALAETNDRPLGVLLRYGKRERDATSTLSRKTSKRDGRVGVAIVGAGSFVRSTHLPNLVRLRDIYGLRAIVSRRGSDARALGDAYDAETISTDVDAVLADPQVDAVLVTTRHADHARQVLAALRAKKHVFCEKPLALTDTDLDEVEDVALQSGKVLMVGFNRRFAPAAVILRDAAQKRRQPLVAIFRMNAGYVPPDHWIHGAEGGGRLVGEACHLIDFCQFLVGAPLVSMAAEALSPSSPGTRASENASAVLRYGDGSICTIVYTALGHPGLAKETVELHVDGTSLLLDDWKTLSGHGLKVDWHHRAPQKGHQEALRAFADGIRSGTWPIAPEQLFSVSRASIAFARAAASSAGE